MKSLFKSATALSGMLIAGSALAADLPRRAAPPPVFTPVPVFTWTGFYAGFNAGYGFDASSNSNAPTVLGLGPASTLVLAPTAIAFQNRNSSDGFVGGGQVGYNYQFTPGAGFVVGIEADAQYVDFGRDRNRFAFAPINVGAGINPAARVFNPNGLSGLDFFGTVRGRLGYAFDRVLFYGTGGFAYGAGGGTNFGLPNNDDFRTGWTAGGGVEYALPTDSFLNFFRSNAVTLKVEALYVNLDRNNLNGAFAVNGASVIFATPAFGSIAVPPVANRRNDEFVVVRAGLNYKFGTW